MPRWLLPTADEDARWVSLFLSDEELVRVEALVRTVAELDVASIRVWSAAEWFRDEAKKQSVAVELTQLAISATGFAVVGSSASGKHIATEEIEIAKWKPKAVLPRLRAWDDVEWGLVHRGDATWLTAGIWFDIDPAGEIPHALTELDEERRDEIRRAIDRLRALLTSKP